MHMGGMGGGGDERVKAIIKENKKKTQLAQK
jgi:hypothetical protein